MNSQLQRKRNRLELYYQAEESILGGAQSYTIGSRTLTRANLSEIRDAIETLEKEIRVLERKEQGIKSRRCTAVTPRDL